MSKTKCQGIKVPTHQAKLRSRSTTSHITSQISLYTPSCFSYEFIFLSISFHWSLSLQVKYLSLQAKYLSLQVKSITTWLFVLIQDLKRAKVSKKGRSFIRLGYQYYDFEYTGSNGWIGAPVKVSDLSTTNVNGQQLLAPLEDAQDIYLTWEVEF